MFSLNDRIEVNWKEIILYPLPLTIGLMFFFEDISILLGLIIGIFFGVLYLAFRAFAWFIYKELIIDKNKLTVRLNQRFLSSMRQSEIIDTEFNFDKISFIKMEKSGNIKFILRYETYKKYDFLIIKSKEDKDRIEQALSRI
jgi:hypothetical protein